MKRRKKICMFFAALLCILPFDKRMVQAEDYWPTGPEIQGEAAVVMEASTGTVLFEKNPHEQLYPASITKIMTTLLALEHCSLDEEVTFSKDSVYNIERDSTHISRDVGEIMTMEQCLYAVMLGSANECAYAVGEHTGKGYDNFIAMMNDKAAELGCTDTHFNNPHGLPDPEHYTSAYDMALISRAAIQNETFRTITGSKRYTIPFTNKHTDEETPLVNHHKMLTNYMGDTQFLYDYCIGGKTGFTDDAGSTLVTYAQKDDMILICVVLKEHSNGHYKDTRLLLDYCFDNFRLWNVSEQMAPEHEDSQVTGTANTEIFGMTHSFADLDEKSCIVLPQSAVFGDADYQVKEVPDANVAASIEYTYAGRVVGSVAIRATNAQTVQYPFHEMSEENVLEKEEKDTNLLYIAIAVCGVITLVLFGFLLYYVINNIFIFRHNIQSRRRDKARFKEIKRGRHTRWKTRW